jgi:hypothetical protein
VPSLSKDLSALPQCTDSLTGDRFTLAAKQLRVVALMDWALLGVWGLCSLGLLIAVSGLQWRASRAAALS